MTVTITPAGATQSTLAELITIYQNVFITAADDPNLDFSSNSFFGQIVNILAQLNYDQDTVRINDYNLTNSIQNAFGVQLDNYGSMFNVRRLGGTYTTTQIDITTSKNVTLTGLDGNLQKPAFTISDGNSNNFVLVNTVSLGVGTAPVLFQAVNIGLVYADPNTLTNLVTVIDGVVSCNNPSAPTVLGATEETDAQYKIRILQSRSITAIGYNNALTSALTNIAGVAPVLVVENLSDVTDSNGIPSHSIWVIVSGGDSALIANAIYTKKSMGCGMKGSVSYDITQTDGTTFTARFDFVTPLPIYIKLNLHNNTTTPINLTTLITAFVKNITFGIRKPADSGTLTSIFVSTLSSLGLDAFASGLQVSGDNTVWVNYITPPALNNVWAASVPNVAITLI
jgi:hypothetical protein